MLLVYTSLKRLDPKYIFDMFKEYEHGLRSASRVQTKHCEAAFSCYAAHTHTHARTLTHTHTHTQAYAHCTVLSTRYSLTQPHAHKHTGGCMHTHTHKCTQMLAYYINYPSLQNTSPHPDSITTGSVRSQSQMELRSFQIG